MRIVLCVFLFCSTAAAADRFNQDRYLRILTGRKEAPKQQLLYLLHNEFGHRPETVDLLAKAARTTVERLNDQPKMGLPASTPLLLRTLAGTNRPEAERALLDLLESPRPEVVIATCLALHVPNSKLALEPLKQLLDRSEFDERYAFRLAAAKAIASIDTPESIEFLEDLLPKLSGRLKYEVWNYLNDETVQAIRQDAQGIDDQQGFGRTQQLNRYASYSRQQGSDYSQYYGIQIYAERLVFVFDRSGSMRHVVGGRSRLNRAKEELIRAIQHLPTSTHFNIITYASDVRIWQPELFAATPKNKMKAAQFISRIKPSGYTATYDALMRALAVDDNTETIFLLSDGAPTKGRIVAKPAIVEAVTHTNSLRLCTLNTIGLAIIGQTENFMRALAENNNGVYRGVH